MTGSNFRRQRLLRFPGPAMLLILLIAGMGAVGVYYAMNSAVNSMGYVTAALTSGASLSQSNLPAGSVVTLGNDTVAFVRSVERLSAKGTVSASEEVRLYRATWSADGQEMASRNQLVGVMAESEPAENAIRIRLVPVDSMPRVPASNGLRFDPGSTLMPLYIQRQDR